VFVFAKSCINIAVVQNFWKKYFTTQFLKRYKFVTMVHNGASFRRLCAFNQICKPSSKVAVSKYIFMENELVLLHFETSFSFSRKFWEGRKILMGIAPERPQVYGVSEIKAVIKGPCPQMPAAVTGLPGINT